MWRVSQIGFLSVIRLNPPSTGRHQTRSRAVDPDREKRAGAALSREHDLQFCDSFSAFSAAATEWSQCTLTASRSLLQALAITASHKFANSSPRANCFPAGRDEIAVSCAHHGDACQAM